MKINVLTVNNFQENCYIYFDESSSEAAIIDPGMYYDYEKSELENLIRNNGLKVKYILNTHGHIDHILGNNFARELTNAEIYLNKGDWFLLETILEYAEIFGFSISEKPEYNNDLNPKSELYLGETKLTILHTPGHSPGGACIIDHKNENVFCGDVLFKNSIGRTDLPKCSHSDLMNSITKNLFGVCGDNYNLYPGHMESTKIGIEKKYNPFLNP